MNTVIECLQRRKSVRLFQAQPVPPELKRALLLAAAAAPTAGNQQLYTILDITDQALKDRLAESCDHQPFIAKAPVVLLFCADCLKWYDAYRLAGASPRPPGVGDLLLAVGDALIAAQNVVTAAESLGLSSCYIGDIMEAYETHREMLNLPDYVFPAAMLVIGWPDPRNASIQKPARMALEHIVCQNGYHTKTEADLRAMFSERIGHQSFEDYLNAFCARKYNSDFSRDMTRSVAQYLAQYDREAH